MTKPNAANERIKHDYFGYLEQAMGRDTATIDGVAKSLARFEESTGSRDSDNLECPHWAKTNVSETVTHVRSRHSLPGRPSRFAHLISYVDDAVSRPPEIARS